MRRLNERRLNDTFPEAKQTGVEGTANGLGKVKKVERDLE